MPRGARGSSADASDSCGAAQPSSGPSAASGTPTRGADHSETDHPLRGRVLGPPPADSLFWDSRCFSGPVVVPPLQSHPDPAAPAQDSYVLPGSPPAGAQVESNKVTCELWIQKSPGAQVELNEAAGSLVWRMYYYGRDSDCWAKGVKALPVPIGRVGLAVSRDGVTWHRVKGPLPGGAVLDPAQSDVAFDSVHVAVGDVFCVWKAERANGDESDSADDDSVCAIDDPAACAGAADGGTGTSTAGAAATCSSSCSEQREWCMLYSGGSLKLVDLPGLPGVKVQGAEIQIGAAWSTDGVHFHGRAERPLLEKGEPREWDQFGVSWPRVVCLSPAPAAAAADAAESDSSSGNHVTAYPCPCDTGDTWLMTYHTRGQDEHGKAGYSAGAAVSRDGGRTWQRLGKVLCGGGPGSWDEQGVSVRSVVAVPFGRGLPSEFTQNRPSVGGQRSADGIDAAATATTPAAAAHARLIMLYEGCNSSNEYAIGLATSDNGGLTWHKAIGAGPEPGGPVLKARRGEEAWDNILVGAPYVVPGPDGNFWMYYVGVGQMQGDEAPRQGIGLAVSRGGDYTRWERYDNV
ncbi:hypothetical protein CLOM_g7626 [Closterium sp. NIES-68]|nr:hypothetical protein CLOM_g7626 [Closterium sp. NIES-68]GJP65831.1 hypothetical protein CLOP_g22744 [Closterium sp. NIES-67]